MIVEAPTNKGTGRGRPPSEAKRSVPIEVEGQRKVLGGRAARIAIWLTDACSQVNDIDVERIVITPDLAGDGFHTQVVLGAHFDG